MDKLIIAGSSGHAKIIIDILEQEGRYEIVGLTDPALEPGTTVFGYPVLGRDDDLPDLMDRYGAIGGLIAIGDNWLRCRVTQRIRSMCPGFQLVSAIHPSTRIARGVQIGPGTVIMAGVALNPDAKVGEGCILATNSSLDHDATMDSYSSLAANVGTGGGTQIGSFTALGMGCHTIQNIKIGNHCMIGAGATVVRDVEDYVVAVGTPARTMRYRKEGERYL